jgi:hypothetical protein
MIELPGSFIKKNTVTLTREVSEPMITGRRNKRIK